MVVHTIQKRNQAEKEKNTLIAVFITLFHTGTATFMQTPAQSIINMQKERNEITS